MQAETVRLIETKSGDDRTLHIATTRVKEMLQRRLDHKTSQPESEQSLYVFPARDGGEQTQVNRVVYRSI